MRRIKGLFSLDTEIFELVYGPEQRERIARHVTMISSPLNGASLIQNKDLLNEVEIVFTGWGGPRLDEHFFELAPNVRAVFHAGGAPRLPQNAARKGVVMSSAHVANSIPVAEYTLATILFSLKHGWHLIQQTRERQTFPNRNGAPGCYNRTVGIIGLGMISRILLRLLKPFDLHVLAYDPFVSKSEADDLQIELVSLDDVFTRSDVVTLHAPQNSQTEGMITGRHLAFMRQGATFINTSRGALVCENEMIQVARTRSDLQFVLDVTAPEPPISGSPLYKLPNVIVTPHIAGSAGGECRRMGDYMAEELERFVAGQPLKWPVPTSFPTELPLSDESDNGPSAARPRLAVSRNIALPNHINAEQIESLHFQ